MIGLGLIWFGWQIISATAADNLAAVAPQAALAWMPDHSGALVEQAQQHLNEEDADLDFSSAADLAERSLRSNALELNALRILALAAEAQGDILRADALMGVAAERSLQDMEVQAWALDLRLAEGDFAGALLSVDAMLRIAPDMQQHLFPLLVDLVGDPEAMQPVIELLGRDPPWRLSFTTGLLQGTEDAQLLHTFYSRLSEGPKPPAGAERRLYLRRLVELGRYKWAYEDWAEVTNTTFGTALIRNGGFEQPIGGGLPFEWAIGSVRGARVDVIVDRDGQRRLRVEFHNTRVPFRHVSQLLLLQPGRYRLVGEARLAALENDRGMQWTISCAGVPNRTLGQTERMRGTVPWSRFEAVFDVPPECEAQMITLVLAARIPAERQVSGVAWFDSLQISKI